jgi:pimeloyl-ACP methyl ester carboxylesterase
MAEPTLNYVHCPDSGAGHRMAYWQWGDATAGHVVLCVHGLSRQGRDFDVLAQVLVARSQTPIRVVCPDVVGRGQSDWLQDPAAYQVPTYAMDMLTLLAQLQPTTLDWVGTSMGGLIGMAVGGQPQLPLPAPVRRLVLNDVGPAVAWVFVERLKTYLGKSMNFASLEQAAAAMWAVSTSFGPHTPIEWLDLSRHMVSPMDDGSGHVQLHFDPAIAVPVQSLTPELAAQGEAMLWHLYDAITAQTLLVRGADSDLLTPATAQAMTQRGPKAQLVEFAGVGHAPTLIAPDQVNTVASFLLN